MVNVNLMEPTKAVVTEIQEMKLPYPYVLLRTRTDQLSSSASGTLEE